MLLSRETSTDWRNWLRGTSWIARKEIAKFCSWGGTISCTSTWLAHPSGKQLDRKVPEGRGREQVEHEPAMYPRHKEGKWYPGLYYEGDHFSILSIGEATLGILCPALGLPVQERHGHTGDNPEQGHKDDEGSGTSLLWAKAESYHFSLEQRRLGGGLSVYINT